MSWVSKAGAMRGALAAIAAMAMPGSAWAGIVISSSGPSAASFPPGKKLADDARVTLRDADTVTILDARGTRVLRGAGTFTVGATGVGNRSATFAALTLQRNAGRVRTGAVRGAGGNPVSPNLWYVDVAKSGPFCVVDPANVRAWRPDRTGNASYRVAGSGHAGTSLTFADGVTVAPWDSAAAPVTDGASFTISGKANAPVTTVTFKVLPKQDYTPEDLAAALMDRQCNQQVDLLASSLSLADNRVSAM